MKSNTNSRQSTNTRIYYFDAIKTLAIFLVIFVHYPMISDSMPSNLSMLLTYVAVPLFFMVNGALLLRKPIDVKKTLQKSHSFDPRHNLMENHLYCRIIISRAHFQQRPYPIEYNHDLNF